MSLAAQLSALAQRYNHSAKQISPITNQQTKMADKAQKPDEQPKQVLIRNLKRICILTISLSSAEFLTQALADLAMTSNSKLKAVSSLIS